jgi:RIO kinase 1
VFIQDSWEEAITHEDREAVRNSQFAVRSTQCAPERGSASETGNVADDWDDLVPQSGDRSVADGARAWKREGKLDRDHKPDGGRPAGRLGRTDGFDGPVLQGGPKRRPTIQRARPDDVGLLTSDEVAFIEDGPKDPLELFADSGYITDVVNEVKSGKEATVYCCRAHPSTGRELVAAKVYAIGIGAHYRMSKLYADGRFRVYKPDSRQERAIKSGKHRGKEMVFADWVGQEYANLCAFHAAGADVPAPIAHCGSGILMDYIGDASRPAPMLVGATLTSEDAQRLFAQAMRNIRIFLAKDRVHGDLSPYNMLLWKGRLVIIDLPQVVHARWNDEAFNVLKRDIENILQFFSRRGVKASATELAIDLWTRYRRGELEVDGC